MKTKNLKAMCSVVLASSLIGGSVIIGMSACSEHETETPTVAEKQTESTMVIDGGVSEDVYKDATFKIWHAIKYSSRAAGNELTASEATQMLQPFIDDGRMIQQQILQNKDKYHLTIDESQAMMRMTDAQLAEMSFTLTTVYNDAVTQGVSQDDIIDCLIQATGLNDLEAIIDILTEGGQIGSYVKGTKMLINAKTSKALIKAFAKRTSGIIGVAWTVYDFTDCLNNKSKN